MNENFNDSCLPFKRRVGSLFWMLILLSISPTALAQTNEITSLSYHLIPTQAELLVEETIDLTIRIENETESPVYNQSVWLYTSQGLTLANTSHSPKRYHPTLTQTITISPQQVISLTIPLFVQPQAKEIEGVVLVLPNLETDHPAEVVARLPLTIINPEPRLTALADYNQPNPPQVTCPTAPTPSYIGQAVQSAIAEGHYSASSACNQVSGDWILDVPNLSSATSNTTAEQFYTEIANLIRQTKNTFSMSTLTFDTHDKADTQNLARYYLAPAIRELHNKTPTNGPYPLLRFAYSPPNDSDGLVDSLQEVYQDLVFNLPNPEAEAWRVSIAIAGIGKIPDAPDSIDDYFPWNHSKVAVRDYQEAIVGGMNWDLDYVNPVDVDDNGLHEPTIVINNQLFQVSRLYDLSIKVEGSAAKETGVFFDLLWRRNIDPIFPYLSDDCVVSWDISFISISDCSLDEVPNYKTGMTARYTIDNTAWVYNLGRGNQGWGVGDIDYSADEAMLAAFAAAQKTIYISQHQMSNPFTGLAGHGYSEELLDGLVKAVVDNEVTVKIALSDPWGSLAPEGPEANQTIYNYLDDKLLAYARQQYGWDTRASAQEQVYGALCRLQFAPFRANIPNAQLYKIYTHNKFFMVDERAFYVGSQNFYPSGFRSNPLVSSLVDLNEYGLLVDDVVLAQQLQQEYWDQIWPQIQREEATLRSHNLPDSWVCPQEATFEVFVPTITH